MSYIKNFPQETVLPLADQIAVQPGQVVSKTLTQNSAVGITLFAFDAGEAISAHDSNGDALVTVLEGVGQFTIEDQEYTLQEGDSLVMPAKKPHAVFAKEAFKMLLVVVFPQE